LFVFLEKSYKNKKYRNSSISTYLYGYISFLSMVIVWPYHW